MNFRHPSRYSENKMLRMVWPRYSRYYGLQMMPFTYSVYWLSFFKSPINTESFYTKSTSLIYYTEHLCLRLSLPTSPSAFLLNLPLLEDHLLTRRMFLLSFTVHRGICLINLPGSSQQLIPLYSFLCDAFVCLI